MNVLKLALIGECMIELQELQPGVVKQSFGGDTLNTAIYCARLGRTLPVQVDYVTALGGDSFSKQMIKTWRQEGVGCDLVLQQPGELPGLYYIELDDQGERLFHYWRNQAAAKKCFEYPESTRVLEALATYDGIYLSGISLAILTPESRRLLVSTLQQLASHGVAIYFDCNYRPRLWTSVAEAIAIYKEMYAIASIVFLTTEEAHDLLEGAGGAEVHRYLEQYGVAESVCKDGGKPCSIAADGVVVEVPCVPVEKVIDTTAAGDSFSAIYLVARHFGCAPVAAAQMAHATAAYVVSHKGALAPLEHMPVSGEDILRCTA